MKNKIILIIHTIIKILKIEDLIFFICNFFNIPAWKALPQNLQYNINDNIKVFRKNLFFTINRSDFTQWQIYANYPELHLNALFENNKNGNIIDIGCNIGSFSLPAADYIKKNNQDFKVYSFEPYISIFKKFEENINLNPQLKNIIIKENIALSNLVNIKYKFNIVKQNLGSNSLVEISNDDVNLNEFLLSDTLDNYVKENNLKNISFIKLDVEGMELEVLDGAKDVIKKYNPSIFIEINENLYKIKNRSFEPYLNNFLNNGKNFFLEAKKNNNFFLEKVSKENVLFLMKNNKSNFNLFIK
jgi:FkbM family methyltransferase